MIEFIGWLGAILFSLCAVPQAIKTYRTKKADDLSWAFLMMWLWGEIFTLIYVLDNDVLQWPLIVNYIFNIVLVLYILWAKLYYKPRLSWEDLN